MVSVDLCDFLGAIATVFVDVWRVVAEVEVS